MALLVFNFSNGQRSTELKPGPNCIGRVEGNDQVVADASVSSKHCEVMLDGENLVIQDLGSTNGTFVKDQKIERALITPGESFRVGNIEVTYVADDRPTEPVRVAGPAMPVPSSAPNPIRIGGARISAPAPALPQADPESENFEMDMAVPMLGACATHLSSPAVATCSRCNKDLCLACVRKEKVGPKTFDFCVFCGGKCVPYGQPQTTAAPVRRTFSQMVGASFGYPFKGNGLILLLSGTLFFAFLDFITSSRAIVLVSLPVLLVKIITYGYLFGFMQKIVSATADGDDEPPGWPDVSEIYQDIFQPFFLFLMTFVVAFGPALLVMSVAPLAGNLLMIFGIFFYPMGLLAVCMADSVSGLNPLVVISAILKMPGAYTVACIFFGALVALRTIIPEGIPDIPMVKPLILEGFGLYLIMIEMRVLGALYYTHKEKFGWF
jgi:hypothetical protein